MHRQSFDSQPRPWREPMDKLDRRSALAFGLIAASAAMVKPAAAQPMEAGKETTLAPGVVQRVYGEGHAIIPDFKTVAMRDIIMQPGSKTDYNPMKNAMVCHLTEGQLRLVQNDRNFSQ